MIRRYLAWVAGLLVFLAALGFAVKNLDPVTVSYYLGVRWQAPLVLILLVAFFTGACAGVSASLVYLLRLKREVLGLKRQLRKQADVTAASDV